MKKIAWLKKIQDQPPMTEQNIVNPGCRTIQLKEGFMIKLLGDFLNMLISDLTNCGIEERKVFGNIPTIEDQSQALLSMEISEILLVIITIDFKI